MEQAKPTRYTIYCHTHIESGRRYVGMTKRTTAWRWNRHVYAANGKVKGWSHFANAIRMYGKNAFAHEVLEICDTLNEANLAEQKWIEHFDTRNPELGFNLAKGGSHTPHPWDRPEYRKKASAASRAKWENPDFRAKLEAKQKEVHARPEWKANMSVASKQAFSKPEVQDRHSDSLKGRPVSSETRRKISAIVKARSSDPEFKKRVSDSLKKASARPDVKERRSAAQRDKKLSAEHRARVGASSKSSDPEVRAKISASLKRHFEERT